MSLDCDNGEEDQEVLDDLENEEQEEEEAELNALSILADSFPDGSSEEEDVAMETDPRLLISQSLMKALLDPRAVEEEANIEEAGNVLEGNASGGNEDSTTPSMGQNSWSLWKLS